MDQPMPGMPGMAEEAQEQGTEVTIVKLPDGTFTVAGQPAKTVEEALQMAAQMLQGGDDYERQQQMQGFQQGAQGL